MKDDYTYCTNSHYLTFSLLKCWENVFFELGGEKGQFVVNATPHNQMFWANYFFTVIVAQLQSE